MNLKLQYNMIIFIDITESILYIRNKSKQKATAERILIQLKKKEEYEDLTLCTLEKKVTTLIEAGVLHCNDSNSILSTMFSMLQQNNKLSLTRKVRKSQTLAKLRNIDQKLTSFSLMKIHQLSQIVLKLYKFFSFAIFLI